MRVRVVSSYNTKLGIAIQCAFSIVRRTPGWYATMILQMPTLLCQKQVATCNRRHCYSVLPVTATF